MSTPAREELNRSAQEFWGYKGQGIADWVLDNLPLVLEAAREAGKAEKMMAAYNGIHEMWHLIGPNTDQGDAT